MKAVLGLVIGLVVGGIAFGAIGAVLLGIVGLLIGLATGTGRAAARKPSTAYASAPDVATAELRDEIATAANAALTRRIYALEQRVTELERASGVAPVEARQDAFLDPGAAAASNAVRPDGTTPMEAPLRPPAVASNATGPAEIEMQSRQATAMPASAAASRTTSSVAREAPAPKPNPVWEWLVGGNTLARLGIVLLFIGVGFLLKYAAEHVRVPIELRLSGVAIGGVALLVIGWRLRLRRRAYAMILQGGGVGVLYLTVFAALRLYALLPPVAAFLLLFWIAALSSFLAIRQDAIALAALGIAGGFLAPILTSTNAGNHVLLFGYFALLNAAIFGIAWFKEWRSLNLLGFAFTFVIATLWGVTHYRPENFATTEPFLILFFLFYVGIATAYALRRSVALRDYVDSALVFGTPLIAAGLQSVLVREHEYGMAISALGASAVYLSLARLLYARRGEGIRLLVEAYLALGVIFATLAIPLVLDARWTSASWALEGAAMLWVGVRQRKVAVRAFGLVLELGAGVAFGLGLSALTTKAPPAIVPILNSAYVGALMVALAGLYSAWLLHRHRDALGVTERTVVPAIFGWGLLWWLGAGEREIDRFVSHDHLLPASVGFLTATAAVFSMAARRLSWPIASMPALGLLPALLAIAAISTLAATGYVDRHLFAHGGGIAWPLALIAAVMLVRREQRFATSAGMDSGVSFDYWHAGILWLTLLLAAQELAWVGGEVGSGVGAWRLAPWGLVPALGLMGVCRLSMGKEWPIGTNRSAYLVTGGVPVAAFLAVWTLYACASSDGDPRPLPYLPLLNPLELTAALALVAGATWVARLRGESFDPFGGLPAGAIPSAFALLIFAQINTVALRTIHFYFDVAYTAPALWRSTLVQVVLSLLWSSMALATMLYAHRRRLRIAWIAGAVLLGVVVVKLFVVELSNVGTVARIVSFIGVGLLMLLIGYLAPVPPRRPEDAS